MIIKYSCHIHKYDTRGSHNLRVSVCAISVYRNGIFNMDIKSYNKLPVKKKFTLSNFKEELKSVLLQNGVESAFRETARHNKTVIPTTQHDRQR